MEEEDLGTETEVARRGREGEKVIGATGAEVARDLVIPTTSRKAALDPDRAPEVRAVPYSRRRARSSKTNGVVIPSQKMFAKSISTANVMSTLALRSTPVLVSFGWLEDAKSVRTVSGRILVLLDRVKQRHPQGKIHLRGPMPRKRSQTKTRRIRSLNDAAGQQARR